MSIEATFAALLDARLAPLRDEIKWLRVEVETLRRHLPPALVPLADAAERMQVSVKTGTRLIKSGDWPGRKIGGKYYVDLARFHPTSPEEVEKMTRLVRVLPRR